MYDQLPGLLSLSSTFVPTVMNLLKKLAEEGQPQRPATTDPQSNPALASKSMRNSSNNDLTSSASSAVTSTEAGAEYSSRSKEE